MHRKEAKATKKKNKDQTKLEQLYVCMEKGKCKKIPYVNN